VTVLVDLIFGAVLAVCMARNFAMLAKIIEARRQIRDLRRRLELSNRHNAIMRRHDEMLSVWKDKTECGLYPCPRTISGEEWLFDLLDCDDPTPAQLDKAEAMLGDLEQARWMSAN
jgi:hypothetical protein